MRRLLVLIGTLVLALSTALPAQAGGWAATELDPLPEVFKADTAYTLGFWVLQHGTHPRAGEVAGGVTGLRFVRQDAEGAIEVEGSALPEAAHYAATVKLPAGTWRVVGVQGLFAPYEVGTLKVPGTLTLAPSPYPLMKGATIEDYWGDIKPPGFPWGAAHVNAVNPPANEVVPSQVPTLGQLPEAQQSVNEPAKVLPATTSAAAEEGNGPMAYLLILAALAGAGAVLLIQRLTRRPGVPQAEAAAKDEGPAKDQESSRDEDVLVIDGIRR